MSSQGSIEELDSFTQRLLRPWSFASQDYGNPSAFVSVVDDARNKSGGKYEQARRRHNDLGAWAQYSSSARNDSGTEEHFAVGEEGWWNQQMLVDRSLRSMAALMTIFAIIMIALCCVYMPDFVRRLNSHSTSVGSKTPKNCASTENTNLAINLIINVAATMILGMSNTYQQLVTSLKTDEVRWVLSKHGDSRVGTNSPLAINHKKTGKIKAWLAWSLLILTSLPIHFLANSVIGPSVYLTPPKHIQYNVLKYLPHDYDEKSFATGFNGTVNRGCWTAFRAGAYTTVDPTKDPRSSLEDMSVYDPGFNSASVNITYFSPLCGNYVNNSNLASLPGTEFSEDFSYGPSYKIGNCSLGSEVICELDESATKQCRLSVRMFAAITLAGCLTVKAIYMITINVRARQRIKNDCLTFGDVIVASAFYTDLRIHNECLVNAGEGNRHHVDHTCHKHCRDPQPSVTGDGIGHCQRCAKFNFVDKAADLLHPSVAIKHKPSLLANLGNTALSQMIVLTMCSLTMLVGSILLAISVGTTVHAYNMECHHSRSTTPSQFIASHPIDCDEGLQSFLKYTFGSFGGYNTSASLASLPSDKMGSEIAAFAISNGAQLLFSILYLLLIYNITLVSIEHDWAKLETQRQRLRCTIVRGPAFEQSYLLQLPKKVLYPLMTFSATMHWLLGQAVSTRESIFADYSASHEHSEYTVVYAGYSVWLATVFVVAMTASCWWAFTYRREGFMPQMYGSIRACCAATTELERFPKEGIQWGDLGNGETFRHAGFSASKVGEIVPGELYAGRDALKGMGS